MALKDLKLAATYSSEESSLLEDFYLPALSESDVYDRAVGFFSAGMLSYAAQGLSHFVRRKGVMRLLIGEPLSTEEYDAVQRGTDLRAFENVIHEKLDAILQRCDSAILKHRLDILSWLVGSNRLEIRFALTDRGMFHEKMGIMGDSEGNRIVFQGSANETIYALVPDFNFESIAIYKSWQPEIFEAYALPYIARFEAIWQGKGKRVTTIDLPSRSYDLLRKVYRKNSVPQVNEPQNADYIVPPSADGFPSLPLNLGPSFYALHCHQRQALQDWKSNDYCGIMALATGSGKTITALHGATLLSQYHRDKMTRNFVLVVSVPYQVLADQWCEVMQLFGIQPHRCYRGKAHWQTELDQAISSLALRNEPQFVGIVVVNATLRSEEFQSMLNRVDVNDMMFVGDECHHHKSNQLLEKLPPARYRLGLSATPWRSADEDGRRNLKGYYAGVVAVYSIADALKDGVLVPYEYLATEVELSDVECEEYQSLSEKLAPLLARKEKGLPVNEDYLRALLLGRMRVLGSAENKFALVSQWLAENTKQTHCLFYCGDGSTEHNTDGRALRDIEQMARCLNENGWRSSRFTADESAKERSQILENFRFSFIDAVVAIRVLDEGFDMPECETAFLLASSRNERQFIQRRGRILRTAPGKQQARIFDYLMLPAKSFRSPAMTGLIRQELVRAVEFSRFSKNETCSMGMVENLCGRFGLNIDEIREEVIAMETLEG